VRREHAVIEDQVDPRARSQSGKLLEELYRLEERMARAIRPGRLQREQDAVIAHAPQEQFGHLPADVAYKITCENAAGSTA
jgi:hypothetical protein